MPKNRVTITSKKLNNVNPGTIRIEAQHLKQEIPTESFNRRSSMNIETELIEEEDVFTSNEPGRMSIEVQHLKKEMPTEPFNRRSSMNIETELIEEKDVFISNEPNIVVREILSSDDSVKSQLVEEAQAINEIVEKEPVFVLPDSPVVSKITLEELPITIEKSLAEELPKIPFEPKMVIEKEIIENIPLPIALTQPLISKSPILKKISDTKAPKQFLRSAPKPIPVLLQQKITSFHSLEKGPTVLQRISEQPTPKAIKILEVRGAPKPRSIIQVNPNIQVKVSENEQVIYDSKNTRITAELNTEDISSSEIKSFKVRDFVRF